MNNSLTDEVLERHGYVVKATRTNNDNVVSVDYAGKQTSTYHLISCEEENLWRINDKESVYLPGYLLRTYLQCEIFRVCRRLTLPYNIVRCYSESGEVCTMEQLVPLNLSGEDLSRERYVNKIVNKIYNDLSLVNSFDDELEKRGVLHNFTLIKGLFL